MSGSMSKRRYTMALVGPNGYGRKSHPLFKAFTLPQREDGLRAKSRRKHQPR